jgi:hypothetical protein
VVDHPRFRRNPAHQGQIALLHSPHLEPLLHPAGRIRIEGEQQDAARGAVEPMDGVDVPAHLIPDELERHDTVPRRAPMDGEPRGLVDGQQDLVAMEDG